MRSVLILTRSGIWDANHFMLGTTAAHATAARGFRGPTLGQHDWVVRWKEARHRLVRVEGYGKDVLVFHLGSGKPSRKGSTTLVKNSQDMI